MTLVAASKHTCGNFPYFHLWNLSTFQSTRLICFSNSKEQLSWKSISARHLEDFVGLVFVLHREENDCATFELIAEDYHGELGSQKMNITFKGFEHCPLSIKAKVGNELSKVLLSSTYVPYILTCTRSGLFWLTRPLLPAN